MAGVTPIADVPDAPTIGAATNVGTSRAYNNGSATVAYTAAATGGTAATFTATSTPGSFTATGASPITVTGLQSATSYTFAVTPTNSTATGPASSSSSSITATTVPAAPTIGTFTDGGTGTTGTLSFTAPATGGSAITNYKYSTDSSTYTALSPSQTSSPLSLTGLTAGTYNFSVKAVNANGDSAASGTVSGTVITPSFYDSIATATGTGSSATISFTSIPSTYKSLQIRAITNQTSGTDFQYYIGYNGDTGTNYAYHILYGNGSTVSAGGSSASAPTLIARANKATNNVCPAIIDIIDYASTTKKKVARSFNGWDNNGTGEICLVSNLWNSTAAITSIDLTMATSNWTTTTTFALYGIKE